jgi:hypothetical protein
MVRPIPQQLARAKLHAKEGGRFDSLQDMRDLMVYAQQRQLTWVRGIPLGKSAL